MAYVRARATHLLRSEGVRGVLAGCLRWIAGLSKTVFSIERYLICQFDTDASSLPERRPQIEGLEVAVLESEEDADSLSERGLPEPVLARRIADTG